MTLAKLASLLLLTVATSSCSAQPPAMTLDYDNLIILDAESLAEAGIGEAYRQLLPELKKHVPEPERIEEVIDPDRPRYAIRINGNEHVVYSPDDSNSEYESWGTATYVFFKVVNDQLAGSGVRFYAINGGNDLGGMFLTPQQAEASRATLPRPSDWPYLPEPTGPWYGQHH